MVGDIVNLLCHRNAENVAGWQSHVSMLIYRVLVN